MEVGVRVSPRGLVKMAMILGMALTIGIDVVWRKPCNI